LIPASGGKADEPRAESRVGTSAAVVADRELEQAVTCFDSYLRRGSVGVLRDVRERFRDDVIGSHLYRRRQPRLGAQVELDGDRRSPGERLEGGPEPALCQDRRMNAARDLHQVFQSARQATSCVRHLAFTLVVRRHRGI
jgi:hypothetical protein